MTLNIMNDDLPPIDSAHAAAFFREQGVMAAPLIISMQLELAPIQRSFVRGANGFRHKDEIADHLVQAVRSVHQGDRYLSPRARESYISIKK
jgi:DNA-binding NarL/FixJ family response regulator